MWPAPRRRPRRLPAPAALLVVALLAAACGADGGEAEGDDAPGSTAGSEGVEILDPTGPDPRGPLFDEFQAGVDRTAPFAGLDAWCDRDEPAPSAEGLSPIDLAVVLRAEEVDPPGSAPGVGVLARRFGDALNACGGIRGRPVAVHEVVVDLELRPGEELADVLRSACVEAVEDVGAVAVLDPGGLPEPFGRCVAIDHGGVLLTSASPPVALLTEAGGRLVTIGRALEGAVADLAEVLDRRALLAQRSIGVVTTTDLVSSVAPAVTAALAAVERRPAVVAEVGCTGRSICADGVALAVDDLAAADVDILIPVLEPEVLAAVLAEMAGRGVAPQLYLTGVLGLDRQAAASTIVAAGEGAARLYDGSLVVDWGSSGTPPDEVPVTAFDQLCRSVAGPGVVAGDAVDDTALVVCAMVRILARALVAATGGARPPVPPPARLAEALAGLGPVDLPGMVPATLGPGDPAAVDVSHVRTVSWPCPAEGFEACLEETGDYQAR